MQCMSQFVPVARGCGAADAAAVRGNTHPLGPDLEGGKWIYSTYPLTGGEGRLTEAGLLGLARPGGGNHQVELS
nr:related to globulin precursor [imported] - Neurospora crassa [Neurospora crassa]